MSFFSPNAPKVAPPPVTPEDPLVQEKINAAEMEERKRRRAASGRASTILAPLGGGSSANIARKTLLGQV